MVPKKTNIIVLDFDGTLFPRRFFDTNSGADPVLVNIIKRLCLEQDFKLVLSASLQRDEEKAKETLVEAGLDPAWLWDVSWKVLDAGFLTGERCRQIERWYEHFQNKIDKFVVFEDEYCPMVSPIHDFWYKCDAETGLSFNALLHLYSTHLPKDD